MTKIAAPGGAGTLIYLAQSYAITRPCVPIKCTVLLCFSCM